MHARTLRHALCTLVVAALTLASASALAQTGGSVTLAPGAAPDPQRLGGVSGGPVQAQMVSQDCRGWIAQQPGHAINVPAGLAFLRVFVESEGDTTLVIRTPGGQFICADDTYGLNPGLDAAYGPGTYLVWVGSYSASDPRPYSITFTQSRTVQPAAAADEGGEAQGAAGAGGARGMTVNSGPGGAITDNHTTEASATVAGACVVRGANVTVRGTHTFFSDLTVRLRGPNGTTDTLQHHQNRNAFRSYTSRRFNGSNAAGTWTLSILDDVGGDSGRLEGFRLHLDCR